MNKITKLSVATLTLVGMFQGIVSHAEELNKSTRYKTNVNTIEVGKTSASLPVIFEDSTFEANVRTGLGIAKDTPITQEDMRKLTAINSGNFNIYFANYEKIKSLKGLEYATELVSLSDYKNTGKLKHVTLPDLSNMSKLVSISLTSDSLDNTAVKNFGTLKTKSTCKYELNGNNITDIEDLKGSSSYTAKNQVIVEAEQTVVNNSLNLKVKDIKDIDGKIPTITVQNGGKYDSSTGIITWNGISGTDLSYTWTSSDKNFSGTVQVPLATGRGIGQTQVTYNTNPMTPDDPTANPDFAVFIPTSYSLSDTNLKTAAPGQVALKTASDFSAYQGSAKVDVTVTSQNNFTFSNGGTYQLVGGDGKTPLPSPITLSSTVSSSPVNVLLTKAGRKTSATDLLDFNYQAHY